MHLKSDISRIGPNQGACQTSVTLYSARLRAREADSATIFQRAHEERQVRYLQDVGIGLCGGYRLGK